MPAGDSPSATLYLERFREPYSGLELLGVGGRFAVGTSPKEVEIRYDGETARVVALPSNTTADVSFGVQLPWENFRTLSIWAITADMRDLLAERDCSAIPERGSIITTELVKPSIIGRGVEQVLTGKLFSPTRWRGRLERARQLARKARQKLRSKLLARTHRPRSVHDAYIESERFAEPTSLRYLPKISIVMPVYNVKPAWFREAVDSVRAQTYSNWELCIADDASTDPQLRKEFAWLANEPRIRFVQRPQNGHICHTTNSAADLATGEYLALLDHDDRLSPHALREVVAWLQSHPEADLLYSDEDKIDENGRRYDPQFKPDFSPELLLSYNYVNHFTVIRRSLFEQVGRFRPGYEGSQDHDLLLRITERTDRVQHIPKILYHWRSHANSTASAAGVKTYVHSAGEKAVRDHLARTKRSAELGVPEFAKRLGLPILELIPKSDPYLEVAIIIHGSADAAAKTVRAINATTDYLAKKLYLVIDDATPAEAMNRISAGRSETYLLFLEAGFVPTTRDWLSRLIVCFEQTQVGAASANVVCESHIVASGTILGQRDGNTPVDGFHGQPRDAVSYYFYAEVSRCVASTSRGILLTPRATFERLGGFDPDRFGRTLFDVDYCLRLRAIGKRIVNVGGVELHAPTLSQRNDDPRELVALRNAFGQLIDPFTNPNFHDNGRFQPKSHCPLPKCRTAAPSPIPVLVAAHNLNNPEGAPRYLSEIVLGLRRRGAISPTIWSPLGGEGAAVYTRDGVPVQVADGQPWCRRFVDGQWTPGEYQAAVRSAMTLLWQSKPDLVLANTLLTFPLIEAARRLSIPCVWIIHESYSQSHLQELFPAFARHRIEQAFQIATRVVPASHDTAALFAHLNARNNVQVLHNGLRAEPFDRYCKTTTRDTAASRLPGGKAVRRFVSVGTVCERKGQHTLIEACAILAKTHTGFVCDLVGLREGVPYGEYAKQLVIRRGLEGVVNLIPETDQVWDYFRAADVFVCTSHMETFSRSILEAEAFGLPIVSTACCGVNEQVSWGHNALQFSPNDAAGLAKHLAYLLDHPQRRTAMAAAARARFEIHLTEDEMLDRYAELVASAAARTAWIGREISPSTPMRQSA